MNIQSIANTPPPTYCPWCGLEGIIRDDSSTGFVEYGVYDGKGYCWEGNIPGWRCLACNRSWFIEPSDAEIHDDCSCEDADTDDEYNADDEGDEDEEERTCAICEKSGGHMVSSYAGDVHPACAREAEREGAIVR